jgi:penicillin-binding protein 1B
VQVAQLYQYLASDGHALPLLAVRGVLDGSGRTIKRYEVQGGKGEYQEAVRLITWALQQVAVYGTAHSIGDSGLAWLHAAGKTGTTNDMRDSWFAGYTANHLAVFWMGRDNNKPTTLFGATGALRAWRQLFTRLPTRPLPSAPGAGLEMAWVNPVDGKRIDQQCAGAIEVPVVAGSLSPEPENCFWQQVFGVGAQPAGPASSGGAPAPGNGVEQ